MRVRGNPIGWISVGIVAGVVRSAVSRGLDEAALWEIVGVEPTDRDAANLQVSIARHFGLWEHVMRGLEDPRLPVLVGSARRTGDLQVRGFAAATSADGWEAVGRAIRFSGLTTDTMSVELTRLEPGRVRLTFLREGARTLGHRCANECALASWVAQLRAILDPGFVPTRVFFRHAEFCDTATHAEFFGCPLEFAANADALEFDAAVLEHRPASSNPEMREFFDRQAERILVSFDSDASALVSEIKRAVVGRLASGPPKVAEVAAALGVGERVLQRQLSDAGTSYTDVVAQVRLRMGKHLLRSPGLSLSEIAFALGFSEHSAFSRFFRRAAGKSPQEFRDAEAAS